MELVKIQNNTLETTGISENLFNRWISFLDVKEKTIETYTKAVRQFFKWLKENGITQPTRNDIINFRDNFMNENYKATTAQNYLMAVKQFFKWLESEGLYKDITKNVKSPKINAGFKKDYLTEKQTKLLLDSVDRTTVKGLRDYAILSLMVTTGLRDIEVTRINREDIGIVGDSPVIYLQGKGRNEKTEFVKIAPPVLKAINDYLEAVEISDSKKPVFGSISNRNNSEKMTTRSVSRIVKTHLLKAGLKSDRLTAHSLRHTTATLNLRNGATLQETQQLLRHSSINTTMIYSHLLEREENNSELRIANAIFN